MKLEKIYCEVKDLFDGEEFNFIKYKDLLSSLEKAVREESAYKTTSKTRVNAIKRVASKLEHRPALTGYGVVGDYKVVTDSYHAIFIYQENMPLEFKENFPNMMNCIPEQDGEELPMVDMDDLTAFIKIHRMKKDNLYKIGNVLVQPQFVKNIIDVLGKDDTKIYFYGENRPLIFKNSKNEIGIVVPVKSF